MDYGTLYLNIVHTSMYSTEALYSERYNMNGYVFSSANDNTRNS